MTRKLQILILLLTVVNGAMAQNGKLFNTENGLSSNMAVKIFQSHSGRIIMATRNGLNLYDGYGFKTIRQESPLGKGLETDYFNDVAENSRGQLVVATNTGIFKFSNQQFSHYKIYDGHRKPVHTYVNSLAKGHDGTLYACTSGFGIQTIGTGNDDVCHPIGGQLQRYSFVSKVMEDSKRQLWVITEDNHLLCRQANGQIMKDFYGLGSAKVTSICEDCDGKIYAGTNGEGLFRLNSLGYDFEHVAGMTDGNINTLAMTTHGILLAGYNGTGITAYDTHKGNVMLNPFFSNLTPLDHGKVESILEDTYGNIWIAMLQKGVFMQPMLDFDFHYQGPRLGSRNSIGDYSVSSVLIARDGTMWVGTDMGGLYQLDSNGRLLRHFGADVPPTIMTLAEDSQGRIWIGSFGNGCGYIAGGTYHHVDILPGTELNVFDIKIDDDGTLWLATMGEGLIRRTADGMTTVFKANDNAYNDQKENSIPNNFLTSVAISADGRRIYVGTSIGLACYDKEKNSWVSTFGTNCLHKEESINCLYVDHKGQLWMGSAKGLTRYDENMHEEHTINIDSGLPANDVYFIDEDRSGRIWTGTSNGLSCLDTVTGKTMNFFADNGLQSNEFSMGAVSANGDGSLLLMGGTGGITWFNPMIVKQPKWNAHVIITGVSSGDYDSVDDSNLAFAHDDNTFTLFLSTNTYNDVEQITYLYKIDGEKWRALPQGSNQLMFAKMPAGKHKLLLKAVKAGKESPVKEYTIRVHSAWYASWWAKLVYFVFFCFIIWLIRNDYRHKRHVEHLLGQIKEIRKFVVPLNKDIDTQTPDDKLIERTMEYINNNLGDSDLSVEKIADAVGISRVHLHRKIKETTGQTPHALVKNLRLRQAASLLENPKQSISDVVYACGFSNTASFSTIFKAEYGVSPREYQKGKRREEP